MRFVIINKILFTAIYYENEIPFCGNDNVFFCRTFCSLATHRKCRIHLGPFHVYTIGLFSETGTYQENERPLMLSFKYEKPIEGKKFCDYAH